MILADSILFKTFSEKYRLPKLNAMVLPLAARESGMMNTLAYLPLAKKIKSRSSFWLFNISNTLFLTYMLWVACIRSLPKEAYLKASSCNHIR